LRDLVKEQIDFREDLEQELGSLKEELLLKYSLESKRGNRGGISYEPSAVLDQYMATSKLKILEYRKEIKATDRALSGFAVDKLGHRALVEKRAQVDQAGVELEEASKRLDRFYGLSPDPKLAEEEKREAGLRLSKLNSDFERLLSRIQI